VGYLKVISTLIPIEHVISVDRLSISFTDLQRANAVERWRQRPLTFVTEVLQATPEPWQSKVLTAVETNKRISIRSGHGVGKSTLLSWLVLWFLSMRSPCKIGTTAPTEHQLKDILWAEIATWLRRMPESWQNLFSLTELRRRSPCRDPLRRDARNRPPPLRSPGYPRARCEGWRSR
jgi:hypothetical protein